MLSSRKKLQIVAALQNCAVVRRDIKAAKITLDPLENNVGTEAHKRATTYSCSFAPPVLLLIFTSYDLFVVNPDQTQTTQSI